jgi:hypothetical protein
MARPMRVAAVCENRRMVRRSVTLVPLVVLALVMAACGSDGADPTAGSSASITTVAPTVETTAAPTTEVPVTEAPTTVAETTTTSTTVVETTTTEAPPPPAAWAPTADWPTLADLPCCASNWVGSPSPAFPDDPAAALAPGIYYANRTTPEAIAGGSLELVLRRFEACTIIPADQGCEDVGGFADTDMGVLDDPAREVSIPLDHATTVVFTGFDCSGPAARWSIDGAGFAEFSAAFDQAYQTLLAGPFLAGEDGDALEAALRATPTGGFSAPCPEAVGSGALQWQWEQSPEATVLLQVLFPGSEANGFAPAPPPSAASYWLVPTAVQVGVDGSLTMYVYGGFYS